MQPRRLLALLIALSVPLSAWPVRDGHAADFDPSGRRRPRGPTPAQQPPRSVPRPDQGAQGPSNDALIKRYLGIVLAQPSAAFPLRRLAELYRERDGKLDKLIDELNQRITAAGPDAWAAKVALAGIYRIDRKTADSVRLYREAIAERPSDPEPVRALADVVLETGDLAEARQLYTQALERISAGPDREQLLRTLIKIALDQKDIAGAKGYHRTLVTMAQGSLFVRAELGRELMQREDYVHAEAEYRELVQSAAGDNRALAPALRDLGLVLVRQNKNQEAIGVLQRALAVAGQAAGVRAEVHTIMAEAYRAEGRVPELIALLEKTPRPDFQQLTTLALLLEETGQVDRALETYRRALQLNQRHIDTRLKVIHLLQAKGELDEAIREYEALIRSVPRNPDFVFELCDILIQRGDRAKALQLLTRLEGQTQDPDQLARLADFYERIEERDRAMRILQRVASSGARDPRYVIDLGDRYYQQGDHKRALETWARLRTIIPNQAEALATLGEVYLAHDMPEQALQAFRQAVELAPGQVRYLKSLAMALERAGASTQGRSYGTRYTEALQVWQQVLQAAEASRDKMQLREARLHIVTLWSLSRQLSAQVTPLSRQFNATPPDLDAGRMLAEVLIRLQQLDEAETTLVRLTRLLPGDDEVLLSLERVYVMQRKVDQAIGILKRLVEIDPKRARQYYQRMAQYAAELYRDDEAVEYAAKAVALAPDDAEGHRKLGEMYRRRQDSARAIQEFRAAIAKNDRLFLVYFDLAELLLVQGETEQADELYRRVVRTCADEELVARAARLSMQLNLGRGTLEVLERELLPAVLGHPQRSVYRRVLVDLYGAMTFPLVQRVRYGTGPEEVQAREQLAKIGTRAVKPLLDALADDNEAQQMIAIEVLGFVQNRSAAPALFAFATGGADPQLRLRAMVACGALKDPELLGRYRSLLLPDDAGPTLLGGPIMVAAAWGVARMQHPKATPLLRELARRATPDVRALALLGLGYGNEAKAAEIMAQTIESADSGNVARAAAAFGLAHLGAKAHVDALFAMTRSPEPLPRQAALMALAQLDPNRAHDLIAEAVFDPDPSVRKAAVAAAVLAAGASAKQQSDPFAVPEDALDVRRILDRLIPTRTDPQDRARALLQLEQPLTRAALHAVATSPDRASLLADALLAGGDKLALAPFTTGLDNVPADVRGPVEQALARILAATAPSFMALVRHPSTELRIRAIRVLGHARSDEAQQAIVDALDDDDEAVQQAALMVLGQMGSGAALNAVSNLLASERSWAMRLRAARALGSLPAPKASEVVVSTLARAAQHDDYALVRQAALEALVSVAPAKARAVLEQAAATDAEPSVRETAAKLLQKK